MDINESLELIIEVLANRRENREYQLYLSTITLNGLNGKVIEYEDFKNRYKGNKSKPKKLSESEKEYYKERNKNIAKCNFKRIN